MVICLKRGANDLHMIQLMPLPSHHLLLHYSPEWSNLSGTNSGCPGKEAIIFDVCLCIS